MTIKEIKDELFNKYHCNFEIFNTKTKMYEKANNSVIVKYYKIRKDWGYNQQVAIIYI